MFIDYSLTLLASNFPGKSERLKLLVIWVQKNRDDFIDIKTFYNEIFFPAVKPLLDEVKPAKASDQAAPANNTDGVLAFELTTSLHINLFLFSLLGKYLLR